MTRGRFYGAAFPIAGILYAILLIATDGNSQVAVIGALCFAAIAIVGATVIRPDASAGRQRNRNRARNRDG